MNKMEDVNWTQDPRWAQKRIKRQNRELILSTLYNSPMTFTELTKKLGLSKPVVSEHLNDLKEQGQIVRDVIRDKIVYVLTSKALKLPFMHTLLFEDGAYNRIARELTRDRDAYDMKERLLYYDTRRLELFNYHELTPKFIAETSERNIIEAIDKCLTPIVLYAILQELKTDQQWSKTIDNVLQKLIELIRQKDVGKFEKELREKYSERLTPKYHFLPSEKIPVIESLDLLLDRIKGEELIDEFVRSEKGKLPFQESHKK